MWGGIAFVVTICLTIWLIVVTAMLAASGAIHLDPGTGSAVVYDHDTGKLGYVPITLSEDGNLWVSESFLVRTPTREILHIDQFGNNLAQPQVTKTGPSAAEPYESVIVTEHDLTLPDPATFTSNKVYWIENPGTSSIDVKDHNDVLISHVPGEGILSIIQISGIWLVI